MDIDLDTVVAKPWLAARGSSVWVAAGKTADGTHFTGAIIQCLEDWAEHSELPLFLAMLGDGSQRVEAGDIEYAREVLLVWADEPTVAVYGSEQIHLDRAMGVR